MQAREVVEITGGEPPIEGGRGGVVAPPESGQPGLDLRSLAAIVAISRPRCPRRCPRCDRGAAGVRDTPYDRALSAPQSRRQARDEGPMTHFRAAASHPPRTSGGDQPKRTPVEGAAAGLPTRPAASLPPGPTARPPASPSSSTSAGHW